jgi:hypothetical protein
MGEGVDRSAKSVIGVQGRSVEGSVVRKFGSSVVKLPIEAFCVITDS